MRLGHVTTLRSNSINSAGFLKSPLSISLYLLRFARHWCVKLISLSLAEVGRVTLYKTWTQVERCHEADSLKKKNERKFKINCAMVFHLMVFWLDDESPARVVSFKIGSKPAWLPLVYVADACTVCWRRRLLSVVLKRPELLPTCQDWRMEDYCVSECAISSSACCLCCVCLCQCVSLCLCSSETLPDPPVFVFAPRAPLHFAFTEGKPCVKMQLTLFPQQDAQQERANTDSHFPCARLYNVCQTHAAVTKPSKRSSSKIWHIVFLGNHRCQVGASYLWFHTEGPEGICHIFLLWKTSLNTCVI